MAGRRRRESKVEREISSLALSPFSLRLPFLFAFSSTSLAHLSFSFAFSSSVLPERTAHADEFWAAEEKLQREVYGIGPLRHILNRRFIEMPWYKSWAKQKPPPPPQPEQ